MVAVKSLLDGNPLKGTKRPAVLAFRGFAACWGHPGNLACDYYDAGGLLMAIAKTGKEVLAKFFDEGAYSALYADGAVVAAFGSANGVPVYAVCQTGGEIMGLLEE